MGKAVALIVAALIMAACQSEDAVEQAVDTPQNDLKLQQADSQTAATTGSASLLSGADLRALIEDSINDPDRLETDSENDDRRRPLEVLEFAGLQPGWKVLDLVTAGGYYAELVARIVGEEGEVWAQNPPQFYERYGSADLDFRLADRRLINVTRHDRPMDDLALPAARFDAITAAMVFHDLYWLSDNVPGIVQQLFDAMRPGGVILITDHAAPEGTGSAYASDIQGQHRIEEAFIIQLMRDAGFEIVGSSDALRNAEDDRSQAFFAPGMRGTATDRFVLLFRKPF